MLSIHEGSAGIPIFFIGSTPHRASVLQEIKFHLAIKVEYNKADGRKFVEDYSIHLL